MKISFEQPDIEKITVNFKYRAFEGKDYPLNLLDHYDFERLSYFLYKEEIITAKSLDYDDISLMSGVRDQGKDCVFYKNNLIAAIIQCKHSKNNKPLHQANCAKEIIKYCLYSNEDRSLLPDTKTFVYYFASSSGFDSAADSLLRSFSKKITNHNKRELWTKQVIKAHKSLETLKYSDIENNLLNTLSQIKIQVILPVDIQSLLEKPYNQHIITKFFSVKSVADNTEVKKLSDKIDNLNLDSHGKPLKSSTILKEFREASCYLSEQVKTTFSAKHNISLERGVTVDILNWIKSDVKPEENICILKGHAGSGKTVILNNVFHQLSAYKIPVIALKADAKEVNSIPELEEKFGLSNPLINSLEVLCSEYEKVVVIIDQLDALSQTLSANRDALRTYILLFNKLRGMQGIRVVVSTREYDLNYDADLTPLKKFKTFDAGLLKEEEVKDLLKELSVKGYTDNLVRLLQTPLHLELFCQVYNSENKNTQFFSLYNLYNELWDKKVSKKLSRELRNNLKATLYSMADKMYSGQLTVIGSVSYDEEDLKLLVSDGLIIKRNSKQIQFFHQTFYDYLFARQFVEKGKNIIHYLKENNQGLFIRSSLKIILAYLRDFDIRKYEQLIIDIITDNRIRFHLKQLTIAFLGFVQEPEKEEKEIAKKVLFNTEFELLFLESLFSKAWIAFALEEGLIQKYYELKEFERINTVFRALTQNIENSKDLILDYLFTLVPDESNHYFINRILWFQNTWNSRTIELFKKVKQQLRQDVYQYCDSLKKALIVDQKWVFLEYKQNLLQRTEKINNTVRDMNFDHAEEEFLKELFAFNANEALLLCEVVLKKIIGNSTYESRRSKVTLDGAFSFFTRKENLNGQDQFLNMIIEEVERLSINNSPLFKDFLKRHNKSNSETFLRILLYGLLANPKKYHGDSFNLIKTLYKKKAFEGSGKLQFLIRQIVTSIYALLSSRNKMELNKMILNIGLKYKNATFTHPATKQKLHFKDYGHDKYLFLCAIPITERNQYIVLKREFQELERKFGSIRDKEPNVIRVSVGSAPYIDKTYKKMSLANWEKSFHKIAEENEINNRSSFKGGVVEHSRTFEKEVSERPEFFFPLIEKIINEKKVDTYYMVQGINGLIKANYSVPKTYSLYLSLLTHQLDTEEHIIYSVWNSDYFIKNNHLTKVLITFLVSQALYGKDVVKDDEQNPLQRAINTIRGAAIDRLARIDDKRFEKEIFDTLNKIIEDENVYYLKATIAIHCAYLLNINPDKAFDLFLKLNKADERLIKESIWSADYFANQYFNQMGFFFEAAIKREDLAEKNKSLAIILAKGWLNNKVDSEKYLFALLKKSNKAKAAIIDVAIHPKNIFKNDGLDSKCVKLFNLYLDNTDKDIVFEYSRLFLRLDPKSFEQLFPLLKKYSQSKVFKVAPAYFCQYIMKCSKQNTYKCSELISDFDKLLPTDISQSTHYDSEPIQVILSIYNTLGDSQQDNIVKEKCMDMFDKMLQIPHLRNAANKAIELVDK
jgi:hypothetical protein